MHEDMRHVPRVRAVLDCLTETFRRIASAMGPHASVRQEQDE